MVPVRRWIPDSVSWARLEDAGRIPFSRLLCGFAAPPGKLTSTSGSCENVSKKIGHDSRGAACVQENAQMLEEPLYLHDWSLPQNLGSDCSLLQGSFQVFPRCSNLLLSSSNITLLLGMTSFFQRSMCYDYILIIDLAWQHVVPPLLFVGLCMGAHTSGSFHIMIPYVVLKITRPNISINFCP